MRRTGFYWALDPLDQHCALNIWYWNAAADCWDDEHADHRADDKLIAVAMVRPAPAPAPANAVRKAIGAWQQAQGRQ